MNNINNNCPPLMSDGRHGTDYRPSCVMHTILSEQNGLKNSHQQRMFMQHNAEKLQALNIRYFAEHSGCHLPYSSVDPNGHDSYWKVYKADLAKKHN
jgi:hypothetical protein